MAQGQFVWISLDINLLALIVATHPGATEQLILKTGLLLQLLGITTVIWGILETRADYKHPTIRSGVKAWFHRCPLITRTHYIEVDSATSHYDRVRGVRHTDGFTRS